MAKENFPYQLFTVGEEYSRNDINQRLVNSQVSQQSGVSSFADSLVLFATLEKEGRSEDIQYKDFFKINNELIEGEKSTGSLLPMTEADIKSYFPRKCQFFWESQNPTGNYGKPQKPLLSKLLKGELKGYLFARIEEKTKSKRYPFIYCGSIEPESYDNKANGLRPFGVKFSCNEITQKNFKKNLKALLEWRPQDSTFLEEAEELASLCFANDRVKVKKIQEEMVIEGEIKYMDQTIDLLHKKFNKYALNPDPYVFTKLVEANSREFIRNTLFPENLNNFILDLIKNAKIKSILDPYMNNGGVISTIAKEFKIKNIHGYEINKSLFQLAKIFNKNSKLSNEYFPNQNNFKEKFDLIFSSPPVMMKYPSKNDQIIINNKKLKFNMHKETECIFSSLKNLSDKGTALFVVSPGFLRVNKNRNVYKFIKDIGFSLEAIFHIPAGTFLPFSGVEMRLIILKKKEQIPFIFEGLVSFNKQRDKNLINNFYKFQSDEDPELGYLRDIKNGIDLKQFIFSLKINQTLKNSNLEVRTLNEISEDIFIASEKTIYYENSIFIFLNGNNTIYGLPIDIDNKFITGIKNKSIAQVVIDPEKINKNILIKVLESPRGKIAFSAFNSIYASPGRTRISLNAIKSLLVVIPDKKKQDKLEELNQKLLDVKFQLNKFEISLWEKIDNPSSLIESFNEIINQKRSKDELDIRLLPFPLASILQTVESFNGIPIKMSLHIEYFFEALSQFLAIYIMSAFYINEEEFNLIWKEVSNFLKERKQNISLSTFGTWNIIFSLLTKKIVQDIKNEESMKEVWLSRLAIDSEDFLDALTSKKLYGILMKAMKLRNIWRGHSGAIGDDNAKERYNTYNEMVKEVLNLFGNFWLESPLVIPGESTFKKGRYNYFCQCAMGVTMPLPRKEYSLKQPLEDGMMHIVSTVSGKSCRLLPLIKFGESPSKDNNACYFYNRRDNHQSQRWISYHNENKPERPFSDPEVNTLLDKLSN